ncbi:MAG: putative SOS response-associated peptidase YedK [Candidatus Latescibacterota bacterium]|jgi:putative SOS response-associated peptidase YedK
MCGRFAFAAPKDQNQLAFSGFIFPDDMPKRYNIAPGQPIIALANNGQKHAVAFKWGLIPSWSKDPQIGNRLINARAETLAEKPSFRSCFKRRRCLIPTTGFYEWKKQPDGKTKVPMLISLKSGQPFAFAGLWEHWGSPEGDEIDSCTIITTEPNELMASIHNRMPVILPPEAYAAWLDPKERRPEDLQTLLTPFPTKEMTAHAVSSLVNIPGNDSAECIAPVHQPEQGALF